MDGAVVTETATWLHLCVLSVVWLLFAVGLMGTVAPILPGPPLIWLGILLDKLIIGAESVSWTFVVVTGVVTALTQVVDYYLSYWGVKRFGGSWLGGVGAMIGLFVGLFLPPFPLWIIIGPVAGAIAGELLGGSSFKVAGKASVGTVVGAIIAFILKFFICLAMIVGFCLLRNSTLIF